MSRDEERAELLRIWDGIETRLAQMTDVVDFIDDNVLEITREQYLTDGKWVTKLYTLVTGTGGPHVEFNTDHLIAVYWGGDKWEAQTDNAAAIRTMDAIGEYFDDIYASGDAVGRRMRNPVPRDVNWYEGNTYDVALGNFLNLDAGGYSTQGPVWIRDRNTGAIEERVGHGKQIGNFHPIWVSWKGKDIQVERLLDL